MSGSFVFFKASGLFVRLHIGGWSAIQTKAFVEELW